MAKKNKQKEPRVWEQKYTIVSNLGEGGNGCVYKVKDSDGHTYALKELASDKRSAEKKERFCEEIRILKKLHGTIGIIPIIDSSVDEYWYTMPVATPASDHIRSLSTDSLCNTDIKLKVQAVMDVARELSGTLNSLHRSGISHRDIKPENILFYNGSYCFGDFGLVSDPDENASLTKMDRGLGAMSTMAPEMRRNPKDADGRKSDVYSFAKTLWILLTNSKLGFDGPYDTNDQVIGLRWQKENNRYLLRTQHLVELEDLLVRATQNSPDDRPDIDEFQKDILDWIKVSEDGNQSDLSEWNFLQKCLFGNNVAPSSAKWVDRDDIIKVLNQVVSVPAANHLFFSGTGGGEDFDYCEAAAENGCIAISVDNDPTLIVKPDALYFERFNDPSWNYFQLKLKYMLPFDMILREGKEGSEDDDDAAGADLIQQLVASKGEYETLVELRPGYYKYIKDADYGVYDYDTGEKLPDGWRWVRRHLEGAFLIVMKTGYYNGISATYDGRHGQCSNFEFRKYIESLEKVADALKDKGETLEQIEYALDKYCSDNPFEDKEAKEAEAEKREKVYAQYKDDEEKEAEVTQGTYDKITSESVMISRGDVIVNLQTKIYYYIEFKANRFLSLKDGSSWDRLFASDILCVENSGNNGTLRNIKTKGSRISKQELIDNNACVFGNYKDALKEIELIYQLVPQAKEYSLFYVDLIRGSVPPNHLFTIDEFRDQLRSADDRVGNRAVVDLDGYVHVIPEADYDESGEQYPVALREEYGAQNKYTGKYANLSDESIRDNYLMLLEGWRDYLEYGSRERRDYTDLRDDKDILSGIKAHY